MALSLPANFCVQCGKGTFCDLPVFPTYEMMVLSPVGDALLVKLSASANVR